MLFKLFRRTGGVCLIMDDKALSKPLSENACPPAVAVSVSMRVGANLLLAFAICFPMATAFQRTESNHIKFWALVGFALFLGASLIQNLGRRPGSWLDTREVRLATLVWLILNCYAGFLLGLSAASFVLPAASFLVVQILVPRKIDEVVPASVSRLLRMLTLLAVICCFATTNQYTALAGSYYRLTGLVTFVCCVLIFVATIRFFPKPTDAERMVQWMLAAAFIVTTIGLLQFINRKGFISGVFTDLRVDPRSMGSFGHPNWFGTYLLLVLPFAVYKYLREGGYLWGTLCCLIHANLLTAQTRGAWIGAGTFFILMFFQQTVYRRRILQLLLMLAVVTAAILPLHDWQVLKRADTLSSEAGKALQGASYTGSGRFGFWKYALERLPRYALLGSGLDTLADIAPPGVKPPVDKAHSVYLEYAVTLGIPGLVIYLMLLWTCVAARSKCFLQWTFRSVIICYLVQGIFIHDTVHTWPLVWFIAGLAVVTARNESPLTFVQH
jgi:O-antigen ligase